MFRSYIKRNQGGLLYHHIVPFGKFHRIRGSLPESFPNVKYDAPKELVGDRKCFYSPGNNENSDIFAIIDIGQIYYSAYLDNE